MDIYFQHLVKAPPRDVCFADYSDQEQPKEYYTRQFNSSYVANNSISTNQLIRTTQNFTIQVVTTYQFPQQEWKQIIIVLSIRLIFISFSTVVIYRRNIYDLYDLQLNLL